MKSTIYPLRKPRTQKAGYKRLLSWVYPFKGTPGFIKELCFELYKWGDYKYALTLTRFLSERAIPHNTYKEWLCQYPQLRYIHEFVIQGISCRREEIAFRHNPANIFLKSQHLYDEEWKEIDEYWSNMKYGNEVKSDCRIVVDIPRLPVNKPVQATGKFKAIELAPYTEIPEIHRRDMPEMGIDIRPIPDVTPPQNRIQI